MTMFSFAFKLVFPLFLLSSSSALDHKLAALSQDNDIKICPQAAIQYDRASIMTSIKNNRNRYHKMSKMVVPPSASPINLQDFIGPIGPSCNFGMTLLGGKKPDGSYNGEVKKACLKDPKNMDEYILVNSSTDQSQLAPCVVYSLGSANQWYFEEIIFGRSMICFVV